MTYAEEAKRPHGVNRGQARRQANHLIREVMRELRELFGPETDADTREKVKDVVKTLRSDAVQAFKDAVAAAGDGQYLDGPTFMAGLRAGVDRAFGALGELFVPAETGAVEEGAEAADPTDPLARLRASVDEFLARLEDRLAAGTLRPLHERGQAEGEPAHVTLALAYLRYVQVSATGGTPSAIDA
ncbi:MAG: hypothetical protein KBD01_12050 [Acidobacteria bacterium]|nr:hypothetical protein [Acidobacteriota bacterium]